MNPGGGWHGQDGQAPPGWGPIDPEPFPDPPLPDPKPPDGFPGPGDYDWMTHLSVAEKRHRPNVGIRAVFRNAVGAQLSTQSHMVNVSEMFHRINLHVQVPANAVSVEVQYLVGNGSTTSTYVVIGTDINAVEVFPCKKGPNTDPPGGGGGGGGGECPQPECECDIDCGPGKKLVERCDGGTPPYCFEDIYCGCEDIPNDDAEIAEILTP